MPTQPTQFAILPERALIRLAGADVVPFLNALLTQDANRLATESAIHAGLLTPKGKLSFDFLLAADGEDVFIDCDAGQRDALMRKLSLYRMGSRLAIEASPQQVIAAWSQDGSETAAAVPAPPEAATGFADPRLAALGARILPRHSTRDVLAMLQQDASMRPSDAQRYRQHRLSLGVAEGAEELPVDQFFPWEACMDLLNGLSLNKGCFIGQEIVSRVYRKGRVSRRLLPLRLADADADADADDANANAAADTPRPGDPIRLQDKHVGALHIRHGTRGLALMQMDAVADIAANPAALTAGAMPAQLLQPAWLRE